MKKGAQSQATPPTVEASLTALERARRKREKAEADELSAALAARAAGASWARIGALYGLTKQGAQQRFKQRPAQD